MSLESRSVDPISASSHDELGVALPRRSKRQKTYPKSKYRNVLEDCKTQRATAGAFYSIPANVRSTAEVLKGKSPAEIANKRLWAEMNLIGDEEVSRGAMRVFESLATEHAQQDPADSKPLVSLMDGDRHLWSLQQEHLPGAIEVLDCFHREASFEAEDWVDRHLKMLLENKVDSVRSLLQRSINHQSFNKTKLEHLKKVYRYFTAHWEFEGAQPMLELRVTKLNGQWEEFIQYRIKSEQRTLYHAT